MTNFLQSVLTHAPHFVGLWKGVLKDDCDLSSIDFGAALSKVKSGALQILLMGSATKLAAPKAKTVFLEDLPPEEIAKVKEPSGLVNLGNTCYLNSVVQCLRAVDPLRKGLRDFGGGTSQNALFVNALKELYQNLDRTHEAVPPTQFVRLTKMTFPQFNQLTPQGQPMQQDAEEFYSGVLTVAAEETSGKEKIEKAIPGVTDDELKGATNLVDALFGMKMEETLTNKEASEEAPVVSHDLHRKLVCNILGGPQGITVNHLTQGISISLNGEIEKHSDTLGRNAVWSRKQRIARLPPYMVVQFGRFYWKATPDSQDHSGVKCKVMRPVAFSGEFDVYEFCSEEVQKILKASRNKALKEEEERIQAKLSGGDVAMKVPEEEDEEAALQAALAMSMETSEPPVGPGLAQNFQGIYELFAVVTHKGRDADGGHYMGWVKAEKQLASTEKIQDTNEANEDWFVFDDDEVSPCKTEDVLKLKGGGDWHMSYLNYYRAKK
mmetsp:Transcript_2340/g.5433  ORF Transcript_2340/g.5433 Transcript_2340/m.5433 type:complete len:493 (+) Transcript_2340:55-1533(+)